MRATAFPAIIQPARNSPPAFVTSARSGLWKHIVIGLALIACHVALHWIGHYFWWPILLIALVPFALLVCNSKTTGLGILYATIAGFLFFVIGQQPLSVFNKAGVFALALVQSLTLIPVALALRWSVGLLKIPLVIAMPTTWVAGEFLRMLGPAGFPFVTLAWPCHETVWLIQICDLFGIYGVSFVVAMGNALAAGMVLDLMRGGEFRGLWRRHERSFALTAMVWLATAGYGFFRLHQTEATMREGPVISVIQPDVPSGAGIGLGYDPATLLQEMRELSERAATASARPQLIVWPEALPGLPALNSEWVRTTPEAKGQNHFPPGIDLEGWVTDHTEGSDSNALVHLEFCRAQERDLAQWVRQLGISVWVGSVAWLPELHGTQQEWKRCNAALHFDPQLGQLDEKQLKVRLFPVGEYIPAPGTFLHDWIERAIIPHNRSGMRLWISPGKDRQIFSLPQRGAISESRHDPGERRYAIALCSEILYPQSSGIFLRDNKRSKPIDFLIEMSNDGMAQRNRVLKFHLAALPFRAVEARIGIARSSNTGISGFAKPTGELYGQVVNDQNVAWTGLGTPEFAAMTEVVALRGAREAELETNSLLRAEVEARIAEVQSLRQKAGVSGFSTQTVYADSRITLYSRIGDLFAWVLVTLTALACLVGFIAARRLQRPQSLRAG
jgi:apolipoprotein N-acyltransferase